MSFSLLKEFSGTSKPKHLNLKKSDSSDAGGNDVVNKSGADEIGFSSMRNTINSNGEITGSDVADYLERATELNDEVDTVPFGLETDDGDIVKVYVNADDADKFEEAMKKLLGVEDDIEEAINKLALDFDIVDVVWPDDHDSNDQGDATINIDAGGEYDGLADDDEMEVVGEYDELSESVDFAEQDDQTEAYKKLSAIANNLLVMSPAGVEVMTGFDRADHTKREMITKHIQEKYASECELIKSWVQESHMKSDDVELPFWLR